MISNSCTLLLEKLFTLIRYHFALDTGHPLDNNTNRSLCLPGIGYLPGMRFIALHLLYNVNRDWQSQVGRKCIPYSSKTGASNASILNVYVRTRKYVSLEMDQMLTQINRKQAGIVSTIRIHGSSTGNSNRFVLKIMCP